MYVTFYRGPQGRLAIVANCVFLFKYCINKKGHNSRKGDNPDKKINVRQLLFHEESIYEISKP